MPTNVNLQKIIINSIPTKEIYNQMKAQGLLEPNQLYLVEEDPSVADMTKAVYDANGAVQNAGGIVEYVAANGGKIDVIKINSTPVPIVDKAVDIDIPTKLSELTDDATHRIVTDTEKAAWNAKGSYSKPSGGIPKTDLASSVQGSLSKADSALQSFTETDPVFKASPAYGISSNDIENWDNKQGPISDLGTIRNNAAAGAAKVSCTDDTVGSFGYTKNTGDMEEAVYDPDGLVSAAGGIPEYVESHSIDPSEKGNSNGVATLDANGKLSASQVPEMDYIPTSEKGEANGVASLGSDGKVPSGQLPAMDYIPTSQKGAASGVASLGSDGKVPSGQLPAMDYIPTSQKGAASGVASLGSDGKVPTSQIPSLSYIPTSQKGVANGVASLGSDGKVPNSQLPAMNYPKIETGSYVGTGAYGASNPMSFTFGFVPKVVIVAVDSINTMVFHHGNIFIQGQTKSNGFGTIDQSSSASKLNVSWSGKSISWYTTNDWGDSPPRQQLNYNGETYRYLAIG